MFDREEDIGTQNVTIMFPSGTGIQAVEANGILNVYVSASPRFYVSLDCIKRFEIAEHFAHDLVSKRRRISRFLFALFRKIRLDCLDFGIDGRKMI